MTRPARDIAIRRALESGSNVAYTTGPRVVMVLGARESVAIQPTRAGLRSVAGQMTGAVFEHVCSSAGAAVKTAELVWGVLRSFAHLGGQGALAQAEVYAEAARRNATRRKGRRWW
jgi:hypothetical protein